MNYPAALDTSSTLPNPGGTDKQNSPDHGALHTAENQAIIALEQKLGIGSTTPSGTGLFLVPTGAGSTAWTQITSAQLAATMTDETGSGSAVFANTPTLVTPKVDTINESTVGNGVTVGGVNLKGGVVSGTSIVASTAATLPQGSITASNLATSAITLGAAVTSSSDQPGITAVTDITGLSTTVTIPSGGRRVRFSWCLTVGGSVTGGVFNVFIKEGSTTIRLFQYASPNGSNAFSFSNFCTLPSPTAGSHTYKLQMQGVTETVSIGNSFSLGEFIVEAI